MSQPPDNTVTAEQLKFLLENHLPDAQWTIGGALRFDASLGIITEFLSSTFPLRMLVRVAGVPPCRWSLDWFVQRRPVNIAAYADTLEQYARHNLGVLLVFDNPFVTEDMLQDPYALKLVSELYRCDRVRKNALCVASDLLATRLREYCPKMPLFCHPNRLVAERGKRTPALYEKLSGLYDRVCLHPMDAVRPSLYTALKEPKRYDAVINDPCLRLCPIRRDHMRLLADMRQSPYDMELAARRSQMIERNGCHAVDAAHLRQKASCNLTHEESSALYAAGFRSFIIQGNQFRNEMTLLWDIFNCLLDFSPELHNKAALIATSAMAQFSIPQQKLLSGLHRFSFSNYE